MEEHLDIKKLHLNRKGNSLLTNNFLKYLRSTFWDDIDSNCFEVNVHECESKLDIPDRLSDVVSERSLKVIRTKNPNRIVLSHLNINYRCLSDVVSERSLKVIRTKNPNRIVLSHLNINYRNNT